MILAMKPEDAALTVSWPRLDNYPEGAAANRPIGLSRQHVARCVRRVQVRSSVETRIADKKLHDYPLVRPTSASINLSKAMRIGSGRAK